MQLARAWPDVCEPAGNNKLACNIQQASDCNAIHDLPYARNLHCPAAFAAAQDVASMLEATLGAPPVRGFFTFYQTLPDAPDVENAAQTREACLEAVAPYPGVPSVVIGGGTPLCDLLACVSSPGPVPPGAGFPSTGNPVPAQLRDAPSFYRRLFTPTTGFPLTEFRSR